MATRRVVVTGIGMVTPLGLNTKSSWNNLIEGRSGVKTITRFNTDNLACKIAGIVDDSPDIGFIPENYIDLRSIHKMDKFIQYGIAAAIEAIEDSGWKVTDEISASRTGLILGSGIGGLKTIEDTSLKFHQENKGKVSPFFIPASLINLLSGHVSIKYGFTGPNQAIVTACASGTHAIGDAMRMIQYGNVDVMVAGGAEAPITPVGVAGFVAARALSINYNATPELASRPWDKDRDGFVMGEGAGIVVLEEYEHALKRGANIYCEVIGYASTGDAYHITSPHPDGRGAYNAMLGALKDAQIDPSKIDYVNAHSTSTKIGDIIELDAVEKLFLNANPNIKMSSTKSATGHLLGAAGGVEFGISAHVLKEQIIPATLNMHNCEREVKIDLVPLEAKRAKIDYILSNSFGFGGTNASLIIRKI